MHAYCSTPKSDLLLQALLAAFFAPGLERLLSIEGWLGVSFLAC